MIYKTQVAIIGAGPAGLLLSRMLFNAGIESIILENRNEAYLRQRLRAGVQEEGTVASFVEAGVGDKLIKEGMEHHGIRFHFAGEQHHIDVKGLTGGKVVTVYGQRNITCDMIDWAHKDNIKIIYEAKAQRLEGLTTDAPIVHFSLNGSLHELHCEYVAGCDGYHGISRPSIPKQLRREYVHEFEHSWYGILAEAPPSFEDVVYAHHPNGFALQSMRSPELSRMYIQCPNGTDPEDWEEEALWDELDLRLGFKNNRGKIVDKSVASMRSFVCDNMQHGKLFIAGDAAHIVPPTGAKGMNLAVSDVKVLAKGLINHYTEKDDTVLSAYSKICLSRIWKVERFSWWVTTSFHTLENQSEFDTKMQEATLGYLCSSDIGAASFAENYVGLPIYWDAK